MILGILLVVLGLVISFYGSTAFNFGITATGWLISSGGVTLFVVSLLSKLLGVHII